MMTMMMTQEVRYNTDDGAATSCRGGDVDERIFSN